MEPVILLIKKEVEMTNKIVKRESTPSATFGNVVDNIFQNSLRRFFDDNFWESDIMPRTGSVPVNVRENEQQYELDVIAPGCRKDDFEIHVNDNVLTISFAHDEQRQEQPNKEGWVRNEYIQRSFSRSFTLDDTVDVSKIDATYKDGILHVVLPKNEKAKKVSLNIQVK